VTSITQLIEVGTDREAWARHLSIHKFSVSVFFLLLMLIKGNKLTIDLLSIFTFCQVIVFFMSTVMLRKLHFCHTLQSQLIYIYCHISDGNRSIKYAFIILIAEILSYQKKKMRIDSHASALSLEWKDTNACSFAYESRTLPLFNLLKRFLKASVADHSITFCRQKCLTKCIDSKEEIVCQMSSSLYEVVESFLIVKNKY
jgi:hypothetical protein